MDTDALVYKKPADSEVEIIVHEEIVATPEIEAARADIETTRAGIAETLGAIKEKLDPAALMDQAKERVEEVAANLADQAKTTVHDVVTDVADHAKEAAGHAKDAAKEAVTGAVSGAVDSAKSAVDSVVHTAKDAGTTVVDTIKRYPFPAALAALGLGYLYMRNRDESHEVSSRSSRGYDGPPHYATEETNMVDQIKEKAGEAADVAKDAVSNTWNAAQGAGMSLVDTIQRNPLPAAAVGLGIAWLFLKNQDENKAHRQSTSQYNYEDGSHYYEESMGNGHANTNGMMDQVKEKAGQVGETVGHALHSAKDKASEMTHQAKEKAGQVGSQAKEQARMAGDYFQRNLEDNPLPMGALALGVGAALGLLIPETERENRLMGTTRDRLMDQAQDKAKDIADKVKMVAEESLDAAKSTAKQEARNQGLASVMEVNSDKANSASETSWDVSENNIRQEASAPGITSP